jgi:glucan biosynthesis protein C
LIGGKAAEREHYWDTLRAFAMLLGIPYHTAMAYRPGQTWIVRSDEGLTALARLAEFIHLFRMPAFFLIAGYFAALLLARREPRAWLKGRVVRLGIPFVTTILTLVPLMNLACEFSNLPYSAALSSFMHNSSNSGGYWVRHLWFIIVLLYCCGAAAALAWHVPALRQKMLAARLDQRIASSFTLALLATALVLGLWQGAAVEAFYIAGLNINLPQQILRLDELIIYAPWFALGCLLQRMPITRASFGRIQPGVVVIAVAFTLLSMTIRHDLHPATGRFIATFAALSLTQILVAAARTFFDRPNRLVRQITDASFVIYLFHMPIIIWLVWLAQGLAIPVGFKALGIMALSLALSWLAWMVIVRSPALSWRFNGISVASFRQSPA